MALSNKIHGRAALLMALLAAVYGLCYLLWFWQTPLGQAPVLDGQENLLLANKMAHGLMPHEPFFRAMLYPAVLSVLYRLRISDSATMMIAVGLMGLICHAVTTLLLAALAGRLWQSRRAAWITGLLFAFNPIAVYFAAEPLDTTLSLTLLVGGLVTATSLILSDTDPCHATGRRLGRALLAGALLALAFLARPHFLPLLLLLPLLMAGLARQSFRQRLALAGATWAGMLPWLLFYAAWQLQIGGTFGCTPWQGPYSFWLSNKPGANGRYITQQSLLLYDGEHQNPTRVESEQLYMQATRSGPPVSIPAMNHFWRQQTLRYITEHPQAWLGLEVHKLYYLINNFEQYNNKTFAFHRQLTLCLRWNPICWGLLFVAATVGLVWGWPRAPRAVAFLSLIAMIYLGGALLFIAGDRFRFPLAPFACLFAGALATPPWQAWRQRLSRRFFSGVLAGGLAACLAFSNFFQAHDTSTFIQDQLLLANASLQIGKDDQALRWAEAALQDHPSRSDARHIAALARFNLHLTGQTILTQRQDWEQLNADLTPAAAILPSVAWLCGVAQWKADRPAAAEAQWRSLLSGGHATSAANALAMLVLTDRATPAEQEKLLRHDQPFESPYVWLALRHIGGSTLDGLIRQHLSVDQEQQIQSGLNRLLQPCIH